MALKIERSRSSSVRSEAGRCEIELEQKSGALTLSVLRVAGKSDAVGLIGCMVSVVMSKYVSERGRRERSLKEFTGPFSMTKFGAENAVIVDGIDADVKSDA